MKNALRLKHVLLIVLVVFGVYANTLGNGFLAYDDVDNIILNPLTTDIDSAAKTLGIKTISYALLHKSFGFNQVVFHANSVILHAVNSVLVYMLVIKLFKSNEKKHLLALLSALAFSVNPVVGESVNWLAGSIYLYFGFNVLVILNLFAIFRKDKRQNFLYYSIAVYVISILILRSPWNFVIPLILLALDNTLLSTKKSFRYKKVLPFFGVALIFAVISLNSAYDYRINDLQSDNLTLESPGRLILVGKNIGRSLEVFAFPFNVSIVHNALKNEAVYTIYFISFYFILGYILWNLFKRDRELFGLMTLFFVSVAPVFSPIEIAVNYAERYYYVAAIFSSIAYVYLARKISSTVKTPKLLITLMAILISVFALRTFVRTFDWRNDLTIWTQAAKVAPTSYRPHLGLGVLAHREDRLEDALRHYNDALAVSSNNEIIHYDIGLTYLKIGNLEEAYKSFINAGKLSPNFPEVYYRLGQINAFVGKNAEAVAFYNKALELKPGFSAVRAELAKLEQN